MSAPDDFVEIHLTPVEIYGTDNCENCDAPGGYGLSDATAAWSDCNRAIGHIFRVDEESSAHIPTRVRIRVLVHPDDLPELLVKHGEDDDTTTS